MRVEWEEKPFINDYKINYEEAWNAMSFGRDIPDGYDLGTAYLAAMRIWLDALHKAVKGHPLIVETAFRQSFAGPVNISGRDVSFEDFSDIALETGIDYQMDAFCSGVPLEYLLEA